MKFAQRLLNRQPPEEVERLPGEEQEQPEELLPIEFVAGHQAILQASAGHWREVTDLAEEIQSDEAQQMVRETIRSMAETNGEEMAESHERALAAQATVDLATVSFLAARATSGERLIHSSLNMVRTVIEDLPPALNYIAGQKDGPKETYGYAATKMRLAMDEADKKARSVLTDLVGEFTTSPNSITALDDLYSDGADLVSPGFSELREIIRTDWHAKDPETSQLRAMMNMIEADPDAFLEEFVENVVGNEGDKKMATIQNMARFALADSATPESPEALRAVLMRNRNAWHTFDDIECLLSTYKSQKLKVLENAMDSIAGLKTIDNPRLAVSHDELALFKRRLRFNITENRQKRRKNNSRGHHSVRRPGIKKAAAVNERYDRTNKPLYFTKNTAASTLTKEVVDKDNTLEDQVRSRVGEHLVSDIMDCIKAINENPIDHSSRMILSGSGRVIIDGKKVRLRRFKPNNAHGGPNISREAASYRICYALIEGSVVVTDILTHDQFVAKF